jgi:hypothetical protein
MSASDFLRTLIAMNPEASETLATVTGSGPNHSIMGYEVLCALKGWKPNPDLAGCVAEVNGEALILVVYEDDANGDLQRHVLTGWPEHEDQPTEASRRLWEMSR